MRTVTAYIALGSNLGDRGETLMAAIKMISEIDNVEVQRISQFIETEPVGGPADQGKYYNAVAQIATTLEPLELLHRLQAVERALGRRRENETRWGARTCDLDILLMDDVVMETDELTIPHPRMQQRLFVLRPLVELAPQVVHPVLNKTARDLLDEAEANL